MVVQKVKAMASLRCSKFSTMGSFLGSPYRGNTWSIGLQCNRHRLSEMMESEASRAAMQSASTE